LKGTFWWKDVLRLRLALRCIRPSATAESSLDRPAEVWLPTAPFHMCNYLTGDVDPK
jgi:hypothetical protein